MIKIDLGSGQFPREGYLGLDIVYLPSIDCVCDMCYLPLADETVEEIYSSHALEHLTHQGGIMAAKEMWRVLAPGGRAEIHVPDLEGHIAQYHWAGQSKWAPSLTNREHAMAGLYGWQSYPGDVHKWGYSYDSLCQLLEQAGFVKIQRFHDHARAGDPVWLAVEAYKGEKDANI